MFDFCTAILDIQIGPWACPLSPATHLHLLLSPFLADSLSVVVYKGLCLYSVCLVPQLQSLSLGLFNQFNLQVLVINSKKPQRTVRLFATWQPTLAQD